MKYNLGSGNSPIDGYENWDVKNGHAAYPLDIPDGSAEEIRASHLLEHFSHREVFDVIKHWVSKLSDGGVLKIAVPDFDVICKDYAENKRDRLALYLMGGQVDENDYHKTIFDKDSLTDLMRRAGLSEITQWSGGNDSSSLPVSLNLMGIKQAHQVKRSIQAVISMPRLCFTDTMNCMMQQLVANRIPVKVGTGVFWSQVLTRMIQESVDSGSDYLLTVDYDSWFTFKHVEYLLAIMERNPELDAVCPMQIKRESEGPLMGVVDDKGQPRELFSAEEFGADYLPILTGHFGLTVFRADAFKKIKKPWFWEKPNADGEWGEGRTDSDIYFWRNFNQCGLKAGIATSVNIGHIQLMTTFPGKPQDGLRPIHVPISQLSSNVPEHCT